MIELGYLGLFISSFLAATVIPFSSETVLSALIYLGYEPILCLVLATLGNFLGGMSSYYIGYLGKQNWIEKYLRISKEKTDKLRTKISGKEQWISFFCWLPIIGDVLAVCLGLLRVNALRVSIGMFIGKAARYAVWAYFTLLVLE